MKYFSLISILLLLLLSGCKVDVVSRADNAKIYASGTACGDDEENLKEDAVHELIRQYPLIAEDLRTYITVNKVDTNDTSCYEAVVTKKAWGRYTRAFESRKEEIVAYAKKHEQIFEYNDKKVLVKIMLMERQQFNQQLENAKKLAPMEIEPFNVDRKTVSDSINVLPSVKIKVRTCNKSRNYNCKLTFSADVSDESKNLTYLWNFGEGTRSEEKSTSHRFKQEGHYNVFLQVTDELGASSFRTENVLVTKNRVLKSKTTAVPKKSIKAYFVLHNKSYKVNTEVYFDNRSKSEGSKIESYLWNFGDGQTSSERNPKHRYKKAGKYIVKYKMCNSDKDCAYASTRVKIVSAAKKVKSVKAVKPVAVPAAKVKKAPSIDAEIGENIQAYIASHGEPSKKIVKKKGTTKAYKFGKIWLLVKYDKVVCAVQEDGFKTTLMGQPKKCNWHKRYAQDYMVDLQ